MPPSEVKTSGPLKPELRKAALQIVRFRAMMDWALALPQWEDEICIALHELQIRAGRQGVSQATALRSLPIEQKFRITRRILSNEVVQPNFDQSKRLARLAGIEFTIANRSFDKSSTKQWAEFRKKLKLRINARYEQYKTGQNELFAYYYYLPDRCCSKRIGESRLRDDASQEARLALLEAIDRIDPEENFESYARHWIERRVQNFTMRERTPVKAPINLISRTLRSQDEGCRELALTLKEGALRLDAPQQTESVDSNLRSPEADSPESLAIRGDEIQAVAEALSQLTPKQREVIECRFGLGEDPRGLSLAQVAQRTGISRQQVFQREKRALHKLHQLLAPIHAERSVEATTLAHT